MFSAPMSIGMIDDNGRYWTQPLFAPQNKVYDSRAVSAEEYIEQKRTETAEECFKNHGCGNERKRIYLHYLVFTDEAGAYKGQTTPEFRKRHLFYVRSNVMISMDDYRDFQKEMTDPPRYV